MEINNISGFTEDEEKCMQYLMDAYGVFIEMERQHPDEMRDFVDAIHSLQNLLAVRVIRRVYPKYWPVYKTRLANYEVINASL